MEKRWFLKICLSVVLSVMLCTNVFGQKLTTYDFGLWAGLSMYSGDMTQVQVARSLGSSGGIFVRSNLSSRFSLRAMLSLSEVKAQGQFESANWYFRKSVADLSVMTEINFFRYIVGSKRYPITTYLALGVGLSYLPWQNVIVYDEGVNGYYNDGTSVSYVADPPDKSFAPNIPVGFGFKFNIGQNMTMGAEFLVHKYFTDKIDDLDDPYANSVSEQTSAVKYTDRLHNNDWLYHFAVFVTYRLFQRTRSCPVYENIN